MADTPRQRLYRFLEEPDKAGRMAWLVHTLLIVLILANVAAVSLESMAPLARRYGPWFHAFEGLSIAVFSAEYLLRVWVCVEDPRYTRYRFPRLRYLVSFAALVDLVAILPFFLGFLIDVDLRSARLLRVLKLGRYSPAMSLLFAVLREEADTLGLTFGLLLTIVVLAATGIYAFEHEAQPEVFSSIPACMWWAVVTLTTVGYGDVVPVTATGRTFAALITVAGVGMVSLPAGIIASGFTQQLQLRRGIFEDLVEELMDDGHLSGEDRDDLEAERILLDLSAREANLIISRRLRRARARSHLAGRVNQRGAGKGSGPDA